MGAKKPLVSVIIPCYNHGQYIMEAINSVLTQTYPEYEMIVVNDQSTDQLTIDFMKTYKHPRVQILNVKHGGLGNARNKGIAKAKGKYILPLDADDKIAPTYIEKAVKILEKDPRMGIVYCQAEFFGKAKGLWKIRPYSFPEILDGNMIFCSAFYRRADWVKVGGYDGQMPSWEDYEFWLRIIELHRKVYRIPEILFYYRIRTNSMRDKISQNPLIKMVNRLLIYHNHRELYKENIDYFLERQLQLEKDYMFLLEKYEQETRWLKFFSLAGPYFFLRSLFNKLKQKRK